eukprot:s3835_g2.t2
MLPHPSPMAGRPKLRVLCLHGRCQTGTTFQTKLERSLGKSANFADFVFIDGPIDLPLQHEERINTKGWWPEGEARSTESPQVREVLEEAVAQQGPFDGVLGFSEGGMAAQLACDLAKAEDASSLASLRFCILVASPPLEGMRPSEIRSLHFASSKDNVVSIEESKRCASQFSDADWVEHEGGHGVPHRAEDVRQLANFLEKCRDDWLPLSFSTAEDIEQETRINQEQKDEVETLSAMFAEELTIFQPTYPVRLAIKLDVPGSDDALVAGSALRFVFPPLYPQAPCVCDLDTESLALQVHRRELMEAVEAAREPLGFPSVMAMLQEAQQWIEEHQGQLKAGGEAGDSAQGGPSEDDDVDEGAWWLVEEAEVDEKLLLAAEKKASELLPDKAEKSAWARQCGAGSYGKPWTFTVGLVGKPSAGKSTLFNAATRSEKEAAMAPHPFTTIDPNDDCEPEHGRADHGRRRFPLLVKDVAGLVPGAYLGRGRGNAFLNDLVDADSLVHVVDASGRSDAEGVDHGTSKGSGKASDPLDEIGWVRREIHMWIFSNVRAKWDTVRRKAKLARQSVSLQTLAAERLFALFTGYHASQQLAAQVYEATGHRLATLPQDILNWGEFDLHLLVACFLRVRFPIVVALNKADTSEATEHIARVQAVLENAAVPVSARSELWLLQQQRKGHLNYLEGGSSVKLTENAPAEVKDQVEMLRQRVLEPYGNTGVMEVLSRAVLQRSPVFCCPVLDFSSLESLPSLASTGGYAGATKGKSKLATMLMLRPLSTVEEVHAALKNEQLLRGDLVRAEMLRSSGQVQTLRRDDVLKPEGAIAVMRILTNKKAK